MPIYIGRNKIKLPNISKAYVGSQLVYQSMLRHIKIANTISGISSLGSGYCIDNQGNIYQGYNYQNAKFNGCNISSYTVDGSPLGSINTDGLQLYSLIYSSFLDKILLTSVDGSSITNEISKDLSTISNVSISLGSRYILYGQYIYTASSTFVKKIDLSNGNILWSKAFSQTYPKEIDVVNNNIYVSYSNSDTTRVVSFASDDGSLIYDESIGQISINYIMVLYDGIYLTKGNTIFKYNFSGRELLNNTLPNNLMGIFSKDGKSLFAISTSLFTKYDSSLKQIYSLAEDEITIIEPQYFNKYIYIISGTKLLQLQEY